MQLRAAVEWSSIRRSGSMGNVSVVCFLASYLVATVAAYLRLRVESRAPHIVAVVMSGAGLFAQTWYLVGRSQKVDLPPLLASTHDWLLVLAWVLVLFYLFLTLLDRELPIGLFALPVVLALVVASRFVEDQPRMTARLASETAKHGWTMLHASLLVFGIIGVIGSLILGLMYLVQHRRLKQKHGTQQGVSLPSLARLARWNWWSVVVSVPLLTLGLAAGLLLGLMPGSGETTFEFLDPIVIGSAVGWLVMMCFFGWLLATKRPAGRQVALLTVWACGFLLVTIVGLQVITGAGHQSAEAATINETSPAQPRA